MPIATPPRTAVFRAFVRRLALLNRPDAGSFATASAVASELGGLLQAPDWLDEVNREPSPDAYRQHLLHVDEAGRFSVVALVWLPGQRTPIHDHVAWCVVGVLEGAEEEVTYSLHGEPDGEEVLVERGRHRSAPGDVSFLVPPSENIHCVRNAGASTAISIHVYGADIGRLGTSINRRFDDVRLVDDHAGEALSWRDSG